MNETEMNATDRTEDINAIKNVHDRLSNRYITVQGGLFGKTTKADVIDSDTDDPVTLMSWADPFYPDPSLPDDVTESLVNAYRSGFPAHYIQPIGSLELREKIADKMKRKNGLWLDCDPRRNVLITPGSDAGLYFAMSAFLDQGDEVLVPDPSYPNNFMNPMLLGAVPVHVPLDAEHGYRLNIDAFEKALTPKTKMVVITHPNNPTATFFKKDELEDLASFIIRHDLVLVCDQAFEDLVFDNKEYISPISMPGMLQRTITVCSISKGLGLSGLRIGYIVASEYFMEAFYGAAVSVIGAANTASQMAAVNVIDRDDIVEKFMECYDRRRRYCVEKLSTVPGVKIELPEAGFFAWVDVRGVGDGNSDRIMQHILKTARVSVNDGAFYGDQGKGFLRIIYGTMKRDEDCFRAIDRIADALRSYPASEC